MYKLTEVGMGDRLQLSKAHEFFPGTNDRVLLISGSLKVVSAVLIGMSSCATCPSHTLHSTGVLVPDLTHALCTGDGRLALCSGQDTGGTGKPPFVLWSWGHRVCVRSQGSELQCQLKSYYRHICPAAGNGAFAAIRA